MDAEGEAEIHNRLADDPWTLAGQLRIVNIEPWKILAGTERLPFRHDTRPTVACRDHVTGSRSLARKGLRRLSRGRPSRLIQFLVESP